MVEYHDILWDIGYAKSWVSEFAFFLHISTNSNRYVNEIIQDEATRE